MGLWRDLNGIIMGFSRDHDEISMGLLWDYDALVVGIIKNTDWLMAYVGDGNMILTGIYMVRYIGEYSLLVWHSYDV